MTRVWAVLKRGLHGVYHQVSKKHLGRYVDEFEASRDHSGVARKGIPMKAPKELDAIVDVVLAYKPKPKTKAAKRRKRKKARDAAKN